MALYLVILYDRIVSPYFQVPKWLQQRLYGRSVSLLIHLKVHPIVTAMFIQQ